MRVDDEARYVETRFADGAEVGATPNTDPHSLQTAAALGYGQDTWAMSRDHELCHTWLSHLEGRPWSPTLWRLGHPGHPAADDDAVAAEEQRVLDFQRSLDKDGPRPWETADVPTTGPLPW
ncbi:MAG: hypothetical protein JWN46_3642 [Acidimicrobiales bacterium]|nr:hypothetical protein [Acidimicrobiales bacterium]